jgi:hypothetical protein
MLPKKIKIKLNKIKNIHACIIKNIIYSIIIYIIMTINYAKFKKDLKLGMFYETIIESV